MIAQWQEKIPVARTIGFLISLCLASGASAATWVPFADCGAADQLRLYSFDSSSVTRNANDVLVRIKGDYSRVQGTRVSEGQIVWALNCNDRTFVEKSRAEYRPDRTVFANYQSPTPAMRIAPNSIADKLLRKVCV